MNKVETDIALKKHISTISGQVYKNGIDTVLSRYNGIMEDTLKNVSPDDELEITINTDGNIIVQVLKAKEHGGAQNE